VLEELGSGGFGRVLLCRDRESGELMAVKELHRFGPDALLRFKKEFRVLTDVQHPNLVRLGELYEGSQFWSFSLEYVPGHDALAYVRTGLNDPGFDEKKLRKLLGELLAGLDAIHALGLLHRDIKPGNIRVTPEGRVVLLDFGLATHLSGGKQTSEAAGFGTIAYMAPESVHGEKLTTAADLYAVGVLMYEALTGTLPFEGSPMQVMVAKGRSLPPRPAELVAGIPPDLDALCMALLATAPADRPSAGAAIATLAETAASEPTTTRSLRAEELFVGRQAELSTIYDCHEQAQRKGFRVLLVEGESGIGKSALVQKFASRLLREGDDTLVLAGKCHAAEMIGFKAFDGVVDELSQYLKGLSYDACDAVLPLDRHLLAVLFPVLDRVPPIGKAKRPPEGSSPERFPLFDTFMELLARLAMRRAVVIVVDDLQWADEASLALLKFLLDTPRAPRLFFLATVRRLSTLDDVVGEGLRALAAHPHVTTLPLDTLSESDSRLLAEQLVVGDDADAQSERVAREASGHPLFIQELARHLRENASLGLGEGLDRALLSRVAQLAPSEREVFELSCAAGGPLPAGVLRAALGRHGERVREAVSSLRLARLLRPVRRAETVVYHDRIREAVLGTIDAATLAARHRSLAEAWERAGDAEPARVALHWLACGEPARAAPWLPRAAKEAEDAGAFERAVEHYRALLALEGVARTPDDTRLLKRAMSEALASAGRCADSARVLLEALDGADAKEAPELALIAAQRLLQAAEMKEGLAAAEKAFGLLKIDWPRSKAAVITRILWNRAAIRLRGLGVTDSPAELTEAQRAELDALRRLSLPTFWADLLHSSELSSRHTRLALALGEPRHVVYALNNEGLVRAMHATTRSDVQTAFARASELRVKTGSVELEAYELFTRGNAALMSTEYRDAELHFSTAEQLYRTRCPGAVWELSNVRGPLLTTWYALGKLRCLAEHAQRWMDEAATRDDRFALATLSVTGAGCYRHIFADAAERARAEVLEVMTPWRGETVGVQHFMEAVQHGSIIAYEGGTGAAAYWAESWPRLESSFLFRIPVMWEALVGVRTSSMLACTTSEGLAPEARPELRRLLRRLRSARSAFGQSFALFYGAQLAWLEGDAAKAAELARAATARFESIGCYLSRYTEVLTARVEKSADAGACEQRLMEWLASEGVAQPRKGVDWWLPVARTWR
jgi:tetratricopeptide (TPR) repeat protein